VAVVTTPLASAAMTFWKMSKILNSKEGEDRDNYLMDCVEPYANVTPSDEEKRLLARLVPAHAA
jgi:hypothetical protein